MFPATIVFWSVVDVATLNMPPPPLARLPTIVQLAIVAVIPPAEMPPPFDIARLKAIVVFVSAMVPGGKKIKPPPPVFETLLAIVQPTNVALPGLTSTPPPWPARLPTTAQSTSVSDALLQRMPPPWSVGSIAGVTSPPVIVMPTSVTLLPAPVILKTRPRLWPSTVSMFAPGPLMVTESVMSSCPLIAIVPVTAIEIVSAPVAMLASAIACLSEPGPLSARFETMIAGASGRAAARAGANCIQRLTRRAAPSNGPRPRRKWRRRVFMRSSLLREFGAVATA